MREYAITTMITHTLITAFVICLTASVVLLITLNTRRKRAQIEITLGLRGLSNTSFGPNRISSSREHAATITNLDTAGKLLNETLNTVLNSKRDAETLVMQCNEKIQTLQEQVNELAASLRQAENLSRQANETISDVTRLSTTINDQRSDFFNQAYDVQLSQSGLWTELDEITFKQNNFEERRDRIAKARSRPKRDDDRDDYLKSLQKHWEEDANDYTYCSPTREGEQDTLITAW